MTVKDHMYDSRIVDIKFHASINSGRAGGQHVISSDRHIVKVGGRADASGRRESGWGGLDAVTLWVPRRFHSQTAWTSRPGHAPNAVHPIAQQFFKLRWHPGQ